MSMHVKSLAALTIGLVGMVLQPPTASFAQGDAIVAIDTLLDPDQTMIKKAEIANQRLLKVFPKGFALDAEHTPHISVLQRYVKASDLEKIYEGVARVLATEKPARWRLKA